MRPEQRLTLLARNQAAKISKEGITRWQHTSPETREAYLKEHPNSAYKDVRVNTMGERISKNPDNREVAQTASQSLVDMGFKKKTNLRQTASHLLSFLHAQRDARETFAKKGVDVAVKVLRKLKPDDKQEVKKEAEAITGDPRKKPSAILNQRRNKALIAGIVGVGVCAALFGTGLLDPNIVAFVGIKALDLGVSTLSNSLGATSLDEFLIASVIGSFVTSRHGEEYGNGMMDRMKRAYGELMGRPKEDEDDDVDSPSDKTDTNDDDSLVSPDSDNDNADDDSSELPNEEEKEDVAAPQDITVQRPTTQKLKTVSDTLEKAGVQATVEKQDAIPGQTLQQSVKITRQGGTLSEFQRAVSALGLVNTKTYEPIKTRDIKDSVTGYLTR